MRFFFLSIKNRAWEVSDYISIKVTRHVQITTLQDKVVLHQLINKANTLNLFIELHTRTACFIIIVYDTKCLLFTTHPECSQFANRINMKTCVHTEEMKFQHTLLSPALWWSPIASIMLHFSSFLELSVQKPKFSWKVTPYPWLIGKQRKQNTLPEKTSNKIESLLCKNSTTCK